MPSYAAMDAVVAVGIGVLFGVVFGLLSAVSCVCAFNWCLGEGEDCECEKCTKMNDPTRILMTQGDYQAWIKTRRNGEVE